MREVRGCPAFSTSHVRFRRYASEWNISECAVTREKSTHFLPGLWAEIIIFVFPCL